MMDEILLGCVALALVARVIYFIRFWKAPSSFGPDRFFGLPLAPDAAMPLLRRYRTWLIVPLVPEAGCLAAVFCWGNALQLFFEQAAVLVVVRVFYSFVAVHIIQQAKRLAAGASWQPVRSIALSLKVRRLADYTSRAFESALAIATVMAIALLTYHYLVRSADLESAEGGWRPAHDFRDLELPVFLIYLQFGGLLVKQGLVKWRMWLPGERTEEYLRWREEVLKYVLWVCDYFRGLATALLLFDALVVSSRGTWAAEWAKIVGILFLLVVSFAGLPAGIRSRRRMATLFQELKPLEAFTRPPQPIDSSQFFFGGLLHYDRENPSLFVPGPLVLAVNLANRQAYLYFAYAVGFALLLVWVARVTLS
jgi:hypothetical protein